MGLRYVSLVIGMLCVSRCGAQEAVPGGRLLTQYLHPDSPYAVGIAPNIPTTVVFPAPGLGFQGVGLMQATDTSPQPVQIEHTPGTNYFTVRAIMPGARSDLNVIFEGRIYAFVFELAADPVRGLTLLRAPERSRPPAMATRTALVSVNRLVEMLDEAKAYDVVAKAYPGYQKNITEQEKGYRIPYLLYDVLIDCAWRFEAEDTIVIRAVFLNKTAHPVRFRPDVAAVKVGARTFYCSIADASGEIPAVANAKELETEQMRIADQLKKAKARDGDALRTRLAEILQQYQRGQSVGYFAITGNPDGTRANISIENNFNLLIP